MGPESPISLVGGFCIAAVSTPDGRPENRDEFPNNPPNASSVCCLLSSICYLLLALRVNTACLASNSCFSKYCPSLSTYKSLSHGIMLSTSVKDSLCIYKRLKFNS